MELFRHALESAHKPARGQSLTATPDEYDEMMGEVCAQDYHGTRKVKTRFGYKSNAKSAMIEIPRMTEEKFVEMLSGIPGVQNVARQTSKASQGNASRGHFMQNNLLVRSEDFPDKPFEFELTTNDHFKRETRTITAMFKTCSDGPHLMEAWRILVEAVGDLAIMPGAVDLEDLRIQRLVRTLLLGDQALERNPEASELTGQALPANFSPEDVSPPRPSKRKAASLFDLLQEGAASSASLATASVNVSASPALPARARGSDPPWRRHRGDQALPVNSASAAADAAEEEAHQEILRRSAASLRSQLLEDARWGNRVASLAPASVNASASQALPAQASVSDQEIIEGFLLTPAAMTSLPDEEPDWDNHEQDRQKEEAAARGRWQQEVQRYVSGVGRDIPRARQEMLAKKEKSQKFNVSERFQKNRAPAGDRRIQVTLGKVNASARHVGQSLEDSFWRPLFDAVQAEQQRSGQSLTADALHGIVYDQSKKWLTTLWQNSMRLAAWRDSEEELEKNRSFLTVLPSVVEGFFGPAVDLPSAVDHLKSLLNAHSGETVSTCMLPEWKLFPCFDQSLTARDGVFCHLSGYLHPQFKLFPDHSPRGEQRIPFMDKTNEEKVEERLRFEECIKAWCRETDDCSMQLADYWFSWGPATL